MKVAEAIGVDLNEKDISVSHRLKTSDSYRGKKALAPPIIVKFTRRKINEEFYRAKKKLGENHTKAKDLGFGFHSDNKLFIVESLTSKNKDLYQKAYEYKREKEFKYQWTSSGNIYLRRTDSSPVIHY